VGYILKGGKHLLALINEVLDIARIEAGSLALSLEPVPVQETVMAMVALVQPLAAQRRIAISVASDRIVGRYVVADRQRLQQVLLNLLANAVKFNRDDGEVRVTVDAPGAGRLRILVQDTGPGIPAEKMKRLFIPFDRLDAEQTTIEGTGLGLALSRRLVETMGGCLDVTSAVGQGSVFSVELEETVSPLGREEATLAAQPVIAEDGRRGVLLYIEDNTSNVRLLERVLARRPHVRLITAMHGRLGFELARLHRPNLILLDLNLPDLPGEEVLVKLRAQPETRDIPVVILSADATPGQIRRMLAEGAMTYLTKPLDVAQLLALVDKVLAASGDRKDADARGPMRSMVGSAGGNPPPGRPAHPEEGQG
jgi:CheY-like chemotaxis protein